MYLIISVICFLFGVYLWVKVNHGYRFLINHVNLFSISWLIVILGSIVFPLDIIVQPKTYLVLICSWVFYLLGSLRLKIYEPLDFSHQQYDYKRLKVLLFILVIFSIIGYLSAIGEIISSITDIQTWASVRGEKTFMDATKENIFYTVFARNYDIYLPLAIYLYVHNELNKKLLILIFIYGILTSIINFSRAPLFEPIIVSYVSYILIKQSFKLPIFRILLVLIGFIFIFTLSQSVLFSLNTYSMFDANYQIKMYLFGSIGNYQLILDGLYPDYNSYSSPIYTLDFINYVFQRLGLITSYPDQIREFNDFSDSNVYTFLDAFTLDLGIIGAFIGSFIVGVIGKSMYSNYEKNNTLFSIILYSLICYYSLMSFANNEFIRFSFILFIIKAYIFELFLRVVFKKRNESV